MEKLDFIRLKHAPKTYDIRTNYQTLGRLLAAEEASVLIGREAQESLYRCLANIESMRYTPEWEESGVEVAPELRDDFACLSFTFDGYLFGGMIFHHHKTEAGGVKGTWSTHT